MAVVSHESSNHVRVTERDWIGALSSRWMLAAILALAFVAYAPTLNDWFVGDDFWFLRASQQTSWGDYIPRVFDPGEVSPDYELNRYRPLYPLAWKLQYALFGMNAVPYHVVAIVLHLAAVTVAWFILRRLLPSEPWGANLAAMIFALHPALANAVAWLSGANRVFAVLPCLAALLLFMKFRDGGRERWLYYASSLVLYAVAMLMHSSTITLVAVLPLYAFLVDGRPRDTLRPALWTPFLPFIALAIGEAAVQASVREESEIEAFQFGWHMWSNIGQFIGLIIIPWQNVDRFGLRSAIENAQIVASFGLLVVMITLAYRRPFWPLAVFAVGWFFLTLLPDSTFLAGAADRAMHAAGAAIGLIAVLAVLYARDLIEPRRLPLLRIAAVWAMPVLAVALVAVTIERTGIASDAAADYDAFTQELKSEGPDVPDGGTLYVRGAPRVGPFNPPSIIESLVSIYYRDTPIVVVLPGQDAPSLGPDDRAFTYTP
jgi:hypothetical protein